MRVQALFIHPVKSARAVPVARMAFDARGPVGDRRFIVVSAAEPEKFVTQREEPRLVLLHADWSADGNRLRLSAPGMQAVEVAVPSAEMARRPTRVWADAIELLDAGDHAADWLQHWLGVPLRLLYQDAAAERVIRRRPGHQVTLADGYPLLIVSAAALDELTLKLGHPADARRFRPNIVVSECPAHAEDRWRRIRIAGNEFELVKACERCTIPQLDPDTGVPTAQFNRVLASYRRWQGQILFGQNAVHSNESPIAVGDLVEVLETT